MTREDRFNIALKKKGLIYCTKRDKIIYEDECDVCGHDRKDCCEEDD